MDYIDWLYIMCITDTEAWLIMYYVALVMCRYVVQ